MTNTNTVEKFAEYAAESYIQTAVYIDDKLFLGNQPKFRASSAKSIAMPVRRRSQNTIRKKLIFSPTRSKVKPRFSPTKDITRKFSSLDKTSRTKTSNDPITMNATDIIKGFAKKQIICSLYQTQPKDGNIKLEEEDIVSICSSADIIILDWKLKNMRRRGGKTTTNIIEQIVKQATEAVPEQLRLIVVYTIGTDLKKIIWEIYKKLSSEFKLKKSERMSMREVQKNLSFKIHNCKISLFKKPYGTEDNFTKKFVVGYEQLAEKTVKEYTKLVPGILQATTLQSLATIRNNYKKIISKFEEDLDRGFLTHLGMTLPKENAMSHVVPLLVSEIESVLEDASPDPLIPEEVLADWIEKKWRPGRHTKKLLKSNRKSELFELGKEILKIGFEDAIKKNQPKFGYRLRNVLNDKHKIFLEKIDSNDNSKFAHLLSNRTFYDLPPKLTLGTIVYEKSKNRFLMCIQPVCDSVRLKENRKAIKFLFVELHKRDPNHTSKANSVITLQNQNIELDYKSKAYDCVSIGFFSGHNETIIAKKDSQKNYYFNSNVGIRYVWKGQLRTAHAQRAAENFGREISRVGLTESEWLRLKAEGKIK